MHLQVPEDERRVLQLLGRIKTAANSSATRCSANTATDLQAMAELLGDKGGWRPFVMTLGLLRVTAETCDEPESSLDEVFKEFMDMKPELLLPEVCIAVWR